MGEQVRFVPAGRETDTRRVKLCRRMLVGPWYNQPEQYEGYNGFVGWSGITRLRSGRWLHTFNSGYWHASYPWTDEVRADPQCRKWFEKWHAMGCPDVYAPRGGRSHVMHSDDCGLTWSKPVTLVDTEMSDLHATILEMDDGALLCTFCSVALPLIVQARYMLSTDGGSTWGQAVDVPGGGGFGNGSAIRLADGTIAWAMELREDSEDRFAGTCRGISIHVSHDRGRTFEPASFVDFGRPVYEPGIAQLPDGRLVLIIRREGDICWSSDGGRTWTRPVTTGVDLYDPHPLVLPSGVLACFHGSYKGHGVRVMLSGDGGLTWHGPADHVGYAIDSTYGYCHPMLLPDGTVYLTYIHTGGHKAADARTNALWGIRVRVADSADGIEILSAPGSPADGGGLTGLEGLLTDGGDAELGNMV